MATLLIVEDDADIALGISEYLEPKGHRLDFAYNGKQALSLLATNPYDLILLDLNLPYVDGLDVCRSLLSDSLARIPVVIMSAREQEEDILKGFNAGAWDYLIKPFSLAELSARITANLAKTEATTPSGPQTQYGGAILQHASQTLTFNGHSLQLHQTGFQLVKLLIEHAPDVIQTSVIHQHLWGEQTPESDPLRAHIYKLRKLFTEQFGQSLIHTIKGVGYQFIVTQAHNEPR